MIGSLGRLPAQLSRALVQWALLLVMLAILGAVTVVNFWLDFRHHREQSLDRLAGQTRLIEASVEHQLEAIDFALGNLQTVLNNRSRTVAGPDVISRHLDLISSSVQGVRTLSVFNADGEVVASNRQELVGRNFRQRDYFREPAAMPDAALLYVTPPFTTVLGVYSMAVARALMTPEGRFAGVVTATLDPAYFGGLLQSARYAEDMHVVLAHGQGGVFQTAPAQAAGWFHFALTPHGLGDESNGPRILEMGGIRRAVVVGTSRTKAMAPSGSLRVLVSRDMKAIDAAGLHGGLVKLLLYLCVALPSLAGLGYWQRWRRMSQAELARQEQALRDSERFMRAVTDNVPGMVGYWTSEMRCAFANKAYLEWFGRSPGEMMGMRMKDLLGQELFEKNLPYIKGVLQGEPQRFERTLTKADGSAGYTWAQYIPDRQGDVVRGFLVLVSDITEVKETQLDLERANAWLLEEMAARRQAQEDLEKANADLRLRTAQAEEASAARSRFLASVSHELRMPLHTVLGYIGLMRKDVSGEAAERLSRIEHSSAQLLRLIDELLEFSRGVGQAEALQPEPVALQTFLAHLAQTGVLLAAARGNHFEAVLGDDLPAAVLVDEQRLVQVLQNLIGNACKYTRDGEVRLRVETDGAIPWRDAGLCRLRFSVEDSGCGIAPEDLPHIFDAFSRGTSSSHQPGLGLGLAIAQRWVRAMGGEIEVSSTPGLGSRFWFALTLPITRPELEESLPCEAYAESLAAVPHTVLVVDDIDDNRLILRDMCRRWGLEVIEASDGEAALAACLANSAIEAVLVDQMMPRMDGWEFLRRVRQNEVLRGLPVALVSASPPQRPDGFPEGVDFDLNLGKPIDAVILRCFLCRRLDAARPSACRWPRAPALPTGLPAQKLAAFQAMVELGRVEALAEWAQVLAAGEPAYGDFAAQVIGYCRAADLVALERLARDVRPTGP